MFSIVTDSEQWCENYDSASDAEKYKMMMEALSESLSPELIEECDLGMSLIDLRDELDENNLIADALALIEKTQQHQPAIYAQEFPTLDTLRVNYYLYSKQIELARSSIAQFKVDPITGFDQMMWVIDILRLYGEKEILIELCSSVYQQVKNSDEVMFQVEDLLCLYIVQDLMETAYHQTQRSETVDWESIHTALNKLDPEIPEEWLEIIDYDLNAKIEINKKFSANFKKQSAREEILDILSTEFCGYMATQKQVNFVTSKAIWEVALEFWTERTLSKKQFCYPESFFTITEEQLDGYVGQLLRDLFDDQQVDAAALIWGLPYIYDFLLKKKVITKAVYQSSLAAVFAIKPYLIKFLSEHLWKYSFVHRWGSPDNISEDDFNAEVEMFKASIGQVTPLSTEKEDNAFASLSREMDNLLPEEILQRLQQVENDFDDDDDDEYNFDDEDDEDDDDFDFDDDEDDEEDYEHKPMLTPPLIQIDSSQLKSSKASKKRKSPLMQAAELFEKDNPPKGKKKKKK
jgi:hypothetical protein